MEKIESYSSKGINVMVPEIGISTYIMSLDETTEHDHDYYEIFYVVNGELNHFMNGQKSLISTGDCFILLPNKDKHYFKNINKNFTHRDIMITTGTFEEICRPIKGFLTAINSKQFINAVKLPIGDIEQLENMFYNFTIETDLDKKNNYGKLIIYKILCRFFEKFYQIHDKTQSNTNRVIQNIIEAFNRTDILHGELIDLIKNSGYSQPYLCKIFKDSTGKTLTEYMNETKMNHSVYYLLYGNYSISQICELVGFKSTSYFNKLFKNYYNMTPTEYKNTHAMQNQKQEP